MFNRLKDEVQEIYIILGNQAGQNPIRDSELSGRIQATKAIIEMDYDELYPEGDK